MTPSEIVRQAQRDVAHFEDPISWVLTPCSEDEVRRVSDLTDPIEFAAGMYNLVRRVEAAAAKYAGENEPRIREAAERVKLLTAPIAVRRERIEGMTSNTPLEEAGKEYLLDRLGWGLWILEDRLPEWGY